jgi:hypothetical protein
VHTVLRRAINPKLGSKAAYLLDVLVERDVEDEGAQQLNVEKVGEKSGAGGMIYGMPPPELGVGFSFPR